MTISKNESFSGPITVKNDQNGAKKTQNVVKWYFFGKLL